MRFKKVIIQEPHEPILIPYLYLDKFYELIWKEEQDWNDVLVEYEIRFDSNICDLAPWSLIEQMEQSERCSFPYDINVFSLKNKDFLITMHDIMHDICEVDDLYDSFVLEGNRWELMSFFREFCLPYLQT